jgi:hypothetical protein
MKDFAPYQQSLELKDLGFDEECFGYYVGLGDNKENPFKLVQIKSEKGQFEWIDNVYHAPTFSQAFRWFREKYGLHQNITQYYGERFYFKIEDMFFPRRHEDYPIEKLRDLGEYVSHEEAELACLIKLIEIVKDEK